MKKIPVYYHPGFAASIGEGPTMPIRKFALVAEALRADPTADFIEPSAVAKADLLRVHLNTFAACRAVFID